MKVLLWTHNYGRSKLVRDRAGRPNGLPGVDSLDVVAILVVDIRRVVAWRILLTDARRRRVEGVDRLAALRHERHVRAGVAGASRTGTIAKSSTPSRP
jgi:hypothetical protein